MISTTQTKVINIDKVSLSEAITSLNPNLEYTIQNDEVTFLSEDKLSVEDIKKERARIYLEKYKTEALNQIEASIEYYKSIFVKSEQQASLLLKSMCARRILTSKKPDETDLKALSNEAQRKGITEIELAKRVVKAENNYLLILNKIEGLKTKGLEAVETAQTDSDIEVILSELKQEADEVLKA